MLALLILVLNLSFTRELVICCVACPANTGFYGFICCVRFPYFTKDVQLLCSLSEWLHLDCSSIGTGFNGAET